MPRATQHAHPTLITECGGKLLGCFCSAIEAETGRGKKVTEVKRMLGDVSGEQKHTGLPCGLFLVVEAESTHGEHVSKKKKNSLWGGGSS